MPRTKGQVKWFNDTKGFGFIQRDEGGKDVFLHKSALDAADIQTVKEGERFSFELESKPKGQAAVNLKRI